MTVNQAIQLLSPEQIALRAGGQAPYLRMPARRDVFFERERRLRQCANGHAMADFLLFCAELAHAQHDVLQTYPGVALPDDGLLQAAALAAMPPLAPAAWRRDPAWRAGLRRMLETLAPRLAGSPAQAAVARLLHMEAATVELQADRLLHQAMSGLDLATAPLIAAGLQAYWTHLVLAIDARHGATAGAAGQPGVTPDGAGPERRNPAGGPAPHPADCAGARYAPPFGRTVDATLCPCCGSRPTASIAHIDSTGGSYRYLHCSLCSAQWHMVRIKCTHCESTKGIQYQSLQALEDDSAPKAAVEAETCGECGHYLKLARMDRDQMADPVADDLATVTLDLLVSEAGFQRHGVNLWLLYGEPDGGEA